MVKVVCVVTSQEVKAGLDVVVISYCSEGGRSREARSGTANGDEGREE